MTKGFVWWNISKYREMHWSSNKSFLYTILPSWNKYSESKVGILRSHSEFEEMISNCPCTVSYPWAWFITLFICANKSFLSILKFLERLLTFSFLLIVVPNTKKVIICNEKVVHFSELNYCHKNLISKSLSDLRKWVELEIILKICFKVKFKVTSNFLAD